MVLAWVIDFLRNAIKVSIYIRYESGRSRFYHLSDRFYFVRSDPRMKPPCPSPAKKAGNRKSLKSRFLRGILGDVQEFTLLYKQPFTLLSH